VSTALRVYLAAHGERGGAGDDRRLFALANETAARLQDADVRPLLLGDAAGLRSELESMRSRSLILPLLFSDGFFYSSRLMGANDGLPHRIAEPLAFWPALPDLLVQEQRRRRGEARPGQTVLVAHGSRTPGRSAACALDLAARLAPHIGPVDVAFLEQPPLARERIAQIAGPWSAIGLFFGDGLHGRDDFSEALAAAPAPPLSAFTVGEARGLADMLAAQARVELAAMGDS
jgi:hypothetical protein